MGTTVTTNLALIKPDLDEKIVQDLPTFDGWAAQNEDNMDILDGLFRRNENTFTLTLTATVNPTLGAGGTLVGRWFRIWPRMVFAQYRVFMGVAGFAAGTGTYKFNMPFAMDTTLKNSDGTRLMPLGKCIFKDNSAAANSSVFLSLYDPSNDSIVMGLSGGGLLDAAAVGASDSFSGYFMYPTSAA